MEIWNLTEEGHWKIAQFIKDVIERCRPYSVCADAGMLDRLMDINIQIERLLDGCHFGWLSKEEVQENGLPDDKNWLSVEPPAGHDGIRMLGLDHDDAIHVEMLAQVNMK